MSSPSKVITPSSTVSSRLAQRSSVDLPEPDAPISTTHCPRLDRQVDVAQHHVVAERLADAALISQHAASLTASLPAPWKPCLRANQSVSRAIGMVRQTNSTPATTYGV